jgi:hypothetical protein
MKTLFSVLAAAAVLGFAAPSTAKADHYGNGQTRVVGYTSWGAPIVAQYRVVGYDRWGRPIGQWVTLPTQRPGCNPGFGSGHHNHGYSGYRPSYSRPRSGISFNFGFGR